MFQFLRGRPNDLTTLSLGADPKSESTPTVEFSSTPKWHGKPSDIWERVERYWYKYPAIDTIDRPKRATESELSEFEAQHHVKLPDDFRQFLLRLNGTFDDGDRQLFCFWSLGRISSFKKPPLITPDADHYFIFADFMIECTYYAIYQGDNPDLQNRVILLDSPKIPAVASTFTEFIELYLADAPRIYGN